MIRGLLEQAFGDGAHVQDHSPIDAGPHDLTEPDLAVVRGPMDFDRLPAARVYARAGVACYWNQAEAHGRLGRSEPPRLGAQTASQHVFV